MIPRIAQTSAVQATYLAFIDALKAAGFAGDLNLDYANRTVLSTDNSIYQVLPQGIIYPREQADLIKIAQLAQRDAFQHIVLSARGGGTGTNGQSLSDGLIVDVSKYMNNILEINVEEGWARVQAGVVKDQLNAAIKPFGLFFAPELSTSNRATIGGMISTDASGQGSCRYGKTRDHVLELTTVLLDGTLFTSAPIDDDALSELTSQDNLVGRIHTTIDAIQRDHADLIKAKFPKLNRCLTGYDLAHIRDDDGRFNLNNIICGSEGTLGFLSEAKINLLRTPKTSVLVSVNYRDFNAALRDANRLVQADPASIETVDSKVLNLAMNDIVWHSVAEFFPAPASGEKIQGINLVEYTADDDATLKTELSRLTDMLDREQNLDNGRIGYTVVWGSDNVAKIWGMRKKAVGLLGNVEGEARPMPFVEDTAVPPEHLADYIIEFRQVLDAHGLTYGMFGHVDAGVLHVRPALDMKDPAQEKMIRVITDQVVALTQKYNGLLWGEHGKGVRSEYAPAFFGELYPQVQRVKAVFDPRNQLNPGKIATPNDTHQLLKIDAVAMRGQSDRKIPVQVWNGYSEGMHCNGNGLCYSWNPNDAMCPSWKGTRDRKHSPKGRASLMREWLTQMSDRGVNVIDETRQLRKRNSLLSFPVRAFNSLRKRQGDYDFSHEVHEAMSGCLACKSCVGQCPIKVDVPEFRAKFLELYYSRYLRPLKDYAIGGLEFMIPTMARVPGLYNVLIKPAFMRRLTAKLLGMVDSPALTGIRLDSICRQLEIPFATLENIAALSDAQKSRAVIVVQDAFTSYFETQLVVDTLTLLKTLGFVPLLAPFKPNGKPLQVHGFLQAFAKAADANATALNGLASSGIALVGIEPAMTLAYRSEYKKVLGDHAPKVHLVQEWLAQQPTLAEQQSRFRRGEYSLLAHCTEKTNAAGSIKDWQTLFAHLGQTLKVIDTGCCGMAGTYGHEASNLDTSKKIYQLSWSGVIANPANTGKLTATGYSCRSQTQRIDNVKLPHPLQVLLAQLNS